MIKNFLLASVFLLGVQTMYAQRLEKIYDKYKNQCEATLIDLPKSLLAFGLKASDSEKSKAWSEKIDSMQILQLASFSPKIGTEIAQSFQAISTKDFEKMLHINAEGEEVVILMQREGEQVRKLLLIATEKDEATLIALDGKMNINEIKKFVNEQTK